MLLHNDIDPAGSAATRPRAGRATTMVLIATALSAIAAPALLIRHLPVVPHPVRHLVRPQTAAPRTKVPSVEPIAYEELTPDQARQLNAQVPFTRDPVPAARPLRLSESAIDQARAVDCLAAAVLYEAGDDARGEQAVAQVVLNRLRHPAFPKSVCGVVFQGSERTTGCQFTFTCDGAMQRHEWTDEAWARARVIARAALQGAVYAPVGYATHYHTDWVVPYWRDSLDKVRAVGSHLFYRWSGWWGTPGAFQRALAAQEPVIPALARWSPAHRTGATLADLLTPGDSDAQVAAALGKVPAPLAGSADSFLVTVSPGLPGSALATLAVRSCGARAYCKFMAWTSAAQTAGQLPLSQDQIAAMAFSYLRDRASGFEKMLWNCRQYPDTPAQQCMKVQPGNTPPAPVLRAVQPPPPAGAPSAPVTPGAATGNAAIP